MMWFFITFQIEKYTNEGGCWRLPSSFLKINMVKGFVFKKYL